MLLVNVPSNAYSCYQPVEWNLYWCITRFIRPVVLNPFLFTAPHKQCTIFATPLTCYHVSCKGPYIQGGPKFSTNISRRGRPSEMKQLLFFTICPETRM